MDFLRVDILQDLLFLLLCLYFFKWEIYEKYNSQIKIF